MNTPPTTETFEAHGYTWTRHKGSRRPCGPKAEIHWLTHSEIDGKVDYMHQTDCARDLDWGIVVGWCYAKHPAVTFTDGKLNPPPFGK